MCAIKRDCRFRDVNTTKREFGAGKFSTGSERGRSYSAHVNSSQRLFSSVKFTHEELTARSKQTGVERIGAVTEGFERLRSAVQPVRWKYS
jgi:hypothetical protein